MPRFIFHTATTLDGFLADADDSLSWLFAVPGADAAENDFDAFLAGVGAFVMGATTYEWVLENDERKNPGAWARAHGARPCFVATHRELEVPAGADVTFVQGEVVEWIDAVIAAAGDGDVWLVGGGDLVGQFADIGRLDVVRVSVAPVVLGAGRPLLPRRIESDRLHLVSASTAGQFAELVYRVTPAAG